MCNDRIKLLKGSKGLLNIKLISDEIRSAYVFKANNSVIDKMLINKNQSCIIAYRM